MSKNLQVPLGTLEIVAKATEIVVNFAWDIIIQNLIVKNDSMTIC